MQERQARVRAELREPLSCLPPSETVWVVDDDDLIEVAPDRRAASTGSSLSDTSPLTSIPICFVKSMMISSRWFASS
jgi:hypothetical protein